MLWYVLAQFWSALVELMRISQLSTGEKDLEILILPQQLDVMARKHRQVIRLPAPVRFGSIGWRRFMKHYKNQVLACDFFTVETIRLHTLSSGRSIER